MLVSGANGYLAIWVVQTLLERGYSVRGTVRSEEKGRYLKEYFKPFGEKLEVVVVEDISKPGAFDEAVKGVDAIAHTASPFHSNVEDPRDFYQPAIRGTVGILESALKNGTNVKRIVVTSSTAAVMDPPSKPTTFSEKDWNMGSVKAVEEKGKKSEPMEIYRASKTLAEKSAWDFVEKNKDKIQWDLTVLNPPFIFGPPIHDVKSLSALNTSLQYWYNMVVADTPKTKESLSGSSSWTDVRDIAEAHVRALEKDAAGGERIIVNGGSYHWQDWIDTANSIQPSPIPSHKLPRGVPEMERVYLINYDKTKEEKILGIKFFTQEESTRDMLADFERRGW